MDDTDINSTDFDEMKYLAQVYGPQRHPWDKLVPLMIGRCPKSWSNENLEKIESAFLAIFHEFFAIF